jgi:hypothetical protein
VAYELNCFFRFFNSLPFASLQQPSNGFLSQAAMFSYTGPTSVGYTGSDLGPDAADFTALYGSGEDEDFGDISMKLVDEELGYTDEETAQMV